MSARRPGSTAASESRVVTTAKPRAASRERSRTVKASVNAFSDSSLRRAPESSPPWAASSTTTNRGEAGGVCAKAAEHAATVTRETIVRRKELAGAIVPIASVERIDRQAAEQLGKKVGGFLRHHLSCKGNFL